MARLEGAAVGRADLEAGLRGVCGELHFGLAQIHRYPSWWTTFGYADSDGFFVKCPCCLGLVDVKASLPGWVQKRVV